MAPQNLLDQVETREPDDVKDEFLDCQQLQTSLKPSFKDQVGIYAYSPGPQTPRAPSQSPQKPISAMPAATPRHKRKASSSATSTPTSSANKRSTSRIARSVNDPYSPTNKLVDSLRPGLTLVLIGLNPGLTTAETGWAYAHSSNLFWKLLHSSGITPIRHPPSDTHNLPDLYNIGNTNLCSRPTRDGSGLSKEEMEDSVPILEEKIQRYKPEAVAVVGKGIWDTIFKVRNGGKKLGKMQFSYGWQEETLWLGREVARDGRVVWEGARTFVATTTSGLAAGMKPHEKETIWRKLGVWVEEKRALQKIP